MDFRVNKLILALILVSVVTGLAVICSCTGEPGESSDTTSLSSTSLKNANSTFVEDLDLAVDLTVYNEEEKVECLAEKVREEINQSVTYDSSLDVPDSLKTELFFFIRDSNYEYTGPVDRSNTFSVNVFKIIDDPIISKPSYLSREYVVRYNISFSPESENSRLKDTVWWYETDATRIIKNLYDNDIGDNIAAVVITFNDVSSGRSVEFLIEAEDMEKLKDYWSGDENYIRYYEWSDLIANNNALVYYEPPSTGIDLPFESPFAKGRGSAISIDDELRDIIKSQSFQFMEGVDGLKKSISNGDVQATLKNSQELIDLSRDFRSEILGYNADETKEPLINEYLEGIASFSKYGSYLWYNSLIPGEISSGDSITYLNAGISRINNVLEMMDEQGYDIEDVQVQTIKSYSDYLPAGIAYHYRDEGECNDISIKVTDYYLKSKLLLEKEKGEVYQEADFGNLYLGVVVDIMHLGYRGGGRSTIQTPALNKYILYYNGEVYNPVTPDYPVLDMGEMYKPKTLSRLERYESLLLFEILDKGQFDPEKGYVEVDLGDYGKQIWSLSNKM